jgi:hypothetical protein
MGWAMLAGSCGRDPSAARQEMPPTQPQTARPSDDDAVRRMQAIEKEALAHIAADRHGPLWAAAERLDALTFHDPANAARRDGLTRRLRAEARKIRSALHRFLFAELGPLPPVERRRLLASADRGDPRPLERGAWALAEHYARAGRAHLRSTPTLRAGRTDPDTRLPVRFAGPVTGRWKKRFNEAFNARMRVLAVGTRPAGRAPR